MRLGAVLARAVAALTLATGLSVVLAGCEAAGSGVPGAPTPTPTSSTTPSARPTPTPEPIPTRDPGPFAAFVTLAEVEVTGTSAEVAGFVEGVEVDGAVCRYTLTPADGGAPVVAEFESLANVGTTSCGLVAVPVASLHRGTWSVTLEFSADGAAATSEPLVMEVP